MAMWAKCTLSTDRVTTIYVNLDAAQWITAAQNGAHIIFKGGDGGSAVGVCETPLQLLSNAFPVSPEKIGTL